MLPWCLYIVADQGHLKGNSSPNGRSIVTRTLKTAQEKGKHHKQPLSKIQALHAQTKPDPWTCHPGTHRIQRIYHPSASCKKIPLNWWKHTCHALCSPPSFTSPKREALHNAREATLMLWLNSVYIFKQFNRNWKFHFHSLFTSRYFLKLSESPF